VDVGRDLGGTALMEIPQDFDWQPENTLVVRVNNNSPSELGVGGIIRPVALIAKEPLAEE